MPGLDWCLNTATCQTNRIGNCAQVDFYFGASGPWPWPMLWAPNKRGRLDCKLRLVSVVSFWSCLSPLLCKEHLRCPETQPCSVIEIVCLQEHRSLNSLRSATVDRLSNAKQKFESQKYLFPTKNQNELKTPFDVLLDAVKRFRCRQPKL